MIRLVIGRRRQGKTTIAVSMARKTTRRIVFDPRGLVKLTPGVRVDTSDVKPVILAIDSVMRGELPECVITPSLRVQDVFDLTCRRLFKWLHDEPRLSFALVVDELRFVKAMDSPEFEWLLRCSDSDRVHIIVTCHRPTDIPTDMRAIADTWIIFRVTQEHDLKVIESRSIAAANAARGLGAREFVAWDDATGEFSTFRKPAQWFVALDDPRADDPDPDALTDLDADVEPQRELF